MNRNNPIMKHECAGCIVVRRKNNSVKVLLLYKKWGNGLEGWVPPKGHLEKGESKGDAALRETIEETGYKNIKIREFLETIHIKYPWDDGFIHQKAIHWFLAELLNNEKVGKKLTPHEVKTTKKQAWFDIDKARAKMRFDDEKELIDIVRKRLKDKKI